jgi:hypothetical protein
LHILIENCDRKTYTVEATAYLHSSVNYARKNVCSVGYCIFVDQKF